MPIACNGLHQLLELGVVLHFVVPFRESLDYFVLLCVGQAADVFGEVEIPGHVNSLQLLITWRRHGHVVHAVSELLEHGGDGLSFLTILVILHNLLRGFIWVSKLHDTIRTKLPMLEVFQSCWNDDGRLSSFNDRAKGHQGNASFEREKISLVVRATLGEHGDGAAVAQNLNTMLKHGRLVNLWQDLELILNIRIVNLGAWTLELKLSVTHHFLDDLLFDVGVAVRADAFD